MDKDLKELGVELDLKEYFTYHPPETEFRKDLHKAANAISLSVTQALFMEIDKGAKYPNFELDIVIARALVTDLNDSLLPLTQDDLCLGYINEAIFNLLTCLDACNDPIKAKKVILMYVQQARMFCNQGITIDEMLKNPIFYG